MMETIQARFYDGEEPLIDLYAITGDFDHYFIDHDRNDLSQEVRNNLKESFNRDAEEFHYLRELDSFLQKVKSLTAKIQKEDQWSNTIRNLIHETFNVKIDQKEVLKYKDLVRLDKNSVFDLCTHRLIESVRNCCQMIFSICRSASIEANNSLMVSQRPEQFPNIISFTKKPVPPSTAIILINQEPELMPKVQSTGEHSSLLISLDTYISVCSMRLMGILTVCDDTIKRRTEGSKSDFYFTQSLFKELETMVDRVADICWGAMQENTLQHEIRKTLLSFQRDRHDELYYMLIRDILTNLNKCIVGVERYLANQKKYDDFIKICHWSMTEEDEKIALYALSKLHPASGSRNLISSATYLRIAIKSVIPPSDLHRVLPSDELPTALTSTDQQPIEPVTKLQWNGNKRVLYDLFAQLTLIDVKPGERLIGNTLKELARFLSDHVEGFPGATTIERELEKMREPQGIEKAKRGRIDLHITRHND